MNYKVIPRTYQEDSAETREENGHIRYEKMYHENYVKDLINQIDQLSDSLHVTINESKNRGTQRAALPYIKKAYDTVRKFKEAKNEP